MTTYDVIIVGGGPAGLGAAIYTTRYKLKTLVLSVNFGGEILGAHLVENYPGYVKISGMELMKQFVEQAKAFGATLKETQVVSIKKTAAGFDVEDSEGVLYHGKTVLVGVGSNRRKLGVPGEQELSGRGVSYCATCDAAFFQNKVVAVIGGGNSAALSTLLLSEYASKVYMMYRKGREFIRAEPYRMDIITHHKKCELILNTDITEIYGQGVVKGIKTNTGKDMKVDGVFIEIGFNPNTSLLKPLGVSFDDEGYVVVKANQATDCPGLFAAGDFTTATNKFKQAVVAAAEGAIAAESVYEYLMKVKK